MKKLTNFIKKHKFISVIAGLILIFLIFIVVLIINFKTGSIYGDRCKDNNEFKISNKTINEAKDEIEKLDNVKNIDIYTKLCTVKIIIKIKDDVDINSLKQVATNTLKVFSEDELNYYDFALYVISDNKTSETYPINVSRHKNNIYFFFFYYK